MLLQLLHENIFLERLSKYFLDSLSGSGCHCIVHLVIKAGCLLCGRPGEILFHSAPLCRCGKGVNFRDNFRNIDCLVQSAFSLVPKIL